MHQWGISQLEFWKIFCTFVIHIYDIHNEISKLDLFGHFYFLASVAFFRGHWKTFLLKAIQQWLVGRFDGSYKRPSAHIKWIPNPKSLRAIPQYSNLLLHLDFGLKRGCIEAESKLFVMVHANRVCRMSKWSFVVWNSKSRQK